MKSHRIYLPRSVCEQWAEENRRDAIVRDWLRELLLTGAAKRGPGAKQRSFCRNEKDDACDRESVYGLLCGDADAELRATALKTERSADAAGYRDAVEALLKSARTSTLAAISRYSAVRLVTRRLCEPPRDTGATDAQGAVVTLPVACLRLAFEWLANPWRLAAVSRQWHRCVRNAPRHLPHHLAFALRRCDAHMLAPIADNDQDAAGGGDSDGGGSSDATTAATTSPMTRTELDAARIARNLFVRAVPTRLRTRVVGAEFGSPTFRSTSTVACFIASLVALRCLEFTLRVDDDVAYGCTSTAPLDALNALPHLETLCVTLEHRIDEPTDLHVPRLPSLTHLDCRTRALPAPHLGYARRGDPTLHIRCESLRVLRLRGRSAGRPNAGRGTALPRIEWVRAQALEELVLDFADAGDDDYTTLRYETLVWAECVAVDAVEYATDAELRQGWFADALRKNVLPRDTSSSSSSSSTRFARSMQRLRRLEIAGWFVVPAHLAALEALRLRRFLPDEQERTWAMLNSPGSRLKSVRARVDVASDVLAIAAGVPSSVTHVDLDVRTECATARQVAAIGEFATRLEAAGGALTWNRSVATLAFRVVDNEEQVPRYDYDYDGETFEDDVGGGGGGGGAGTLGLETSRPDDDFDV